MEFVRAGAEEAGRDPDDIVIHCSAATYVSGDMDEAREQHPLVPGARRQPHRRRPAPPRRARNCPQELFDYVHDRPSTTTAQHGHPGADHSKYVPDAICDRFCVLGTEEECEAKLRELADARASSEFNIYPYIPNLLETVELYGRSIAPKISTAAVTSGEVR